VDRLRSLVRTTTFSVSKDAGQSRVMCDGTGLMQGNLTVCADDAFVPLLIWMVSNVYTPFPMYQYVHILYLVTILVYK